MSHVAEDRDVMLNPSRPSVMAVTESHSLKISPSAFRLTISPCQRPADLRLSQNAC
ncbi:hypothetical protein V3851_13570 [Paenibacillus sp. M1]|uniref:Uncharacterized protein n=1 Tax=Paenibacillus haidiansis TaxID=1574488 RepID=A0ABU7VT15_9BACL